MADELTYSIIIPERNGADQHRRHLDAVVAWARKSGSAVETILVDDGSDDGGEAARRSAFDAGPSCRFVGLERSVGFAGACNAGASAARGRLLFFLNSDMHPGQGNLATLAAELDRDESRFAVAPAIFNLRESFFEGDLRVRIRHGVFDVLQPGRKEASPAGAVRRTAYACGGALLVRRDRFRELGGFSTLFSPFYWEDADIGWRARRRGWDCIEAGTVAMLHDHAQTIGSLYSSADVAAIYERNRLLFTWLHLGGARAWVAHFAWIPLRCGAAIVRRDPCGPGFAAALRRAPAAMRVRRTLAETRTDARRLTDQVRRSGAAGWPRQAP